MRILIDISHPAHVHLFRNFSAEMHKREHKVLFTARKKDLTIELLKGFGLNFISFGGNYNSILGKIWGLIRFSFLIAKVSISFKPDLYFSAGSYYATLVAFLFRKPSISMHNNEADIFANLISFFASNCLVPSSSNESSNNKIIKYSGYHELAFLHRDNFTPNPAILKSFGLTKDDKFTLIRFVSSNAFDDIGFGQGINDNEKREIVSTLLNYGKVIITSENELPKDLWKYQLEKKIKKIAGQLQNIEYYATLFFGESGAMTAECAILGTPAIYVNKKKLGFINELVDKYELAYNFFDYKDALKKSEELLNQNHLKAIWKKRLDIMLSNCINVTDFMVWFIENYPKSKAIMKENPDYQYYFK